MSAVHHSRPDPLLNVVQSHPQEALWFVKVVTLFGGISGVLVSVLCVIFLSMYWTPCGSCNRPLRYWILVQSILQLLQSPMRLAFYRRVHRAPQATEELYEWFRQLTDSPAWRVSKMVSVATYGWFILGVVWLLNSTHCKHCPGLYRLCLAVVFTGVARLLLTLIIFYHSFQPGEEATPPPKPRGASQSLINSLPVERFTAKTSECSETSCAVCLSDFEEREMLRRLPCHHSFHRGCVDKWLLQNKVCPLCVQDVEVLSQQRDDHTLCPDSSSTSCCQRVGASLWTTAREMRGRASLL